MNTSAYRLQLGLGIRPTVAVIVIFLMSLTAHTVDGAFTSCYLYNGDVSDLSFTYNFNEARIAAHAKLINHYSIDLLSNAYSDFNLVKNITAQLEYLIYSDHCDLIVSTWHTLLQNFDTRSFALRFPSVTIVERTEGVVFSSVPNNYANYLVQRAQNLFMAGAVASRQALSCVGLIYPSVEQSWAPDAFYRGFLWANSSVALFAVNLDLDSSMASEAAAATLLAKKGCDVIASVTFNSFLPTVVASMNNDAVMSIGFGADASLTAGDSVLTSMYVDLTDLFFNVTSDAIQVYQGSLPRTPVTYLAQKSTEMVLADVSPQASVGLVQLAAQARMKADSMDCSCGTFSDENGALHTGCLQETQKNSYPYLDARIHRMTSWRPPSVCPAGTVYSYTVADFSLTCTPCPAGSYSSVAGSTSCTPCAVGLVSTAGSSSCYVAAQSSFQLLLIIPIVIGALIFTLLVVALVIYFLRVEIAPSRDAKNAPRGPDVAFAMIGVDGSRSDRQWRASLTNMCDVYDRLASIVTPIANRKKAYIFVSVGDIVMIAMKNPSELLQLLTEVQERASQSHWPCQIRLKMVLHSGKPVIGENKKHGSDDDVRMTYSGADLDLVRAMWRKDIGCDLTVTESTAKMLSFQNGVHQVTGPLAFALEEKQISTSVMSVTFTVNNLEKGSVAINPLDLSSPALENETDSRKGPSGTASETSEGVEDDLARLVTPSAVTKEELDALRSLGVDLLQKFLRVFSFDDQVSIVTAIAKKLHVQTPKIPEMKTAVKKSFNVLRNSLKQICNQLLMSMDEKELQIWLDAVAAHAQKREITEVNAPAPATPGKIEDQVSARPAPTIQ